MARTDTNKTDPDRHEETENKAKLDTRDHRRTLEKTCGIEQGQRAEKSGHRRNHVIFSYRRIGR